MATMLNLFADIKEKRVGISKFNETENDNNLNIPTCLKSMNNPLNGSKAVKGMVTYEQIKTRMDTLLQNYKVQATKIILEITKFEVEQKKKKKLISAMNDCVYVPDNTLTILKLETKQWQATLERKEIAANADLKMYKTLLNDTFFTLLTAERDDVIASFKLEDMKDGIIEIIYLPDYQGYEYAQLIQTVALPPTNTLLAPTLQLFARKVKK